jgi:hypothetical protein
MAWRRLVKKVSSRLNPFIPAQVCAGGRGVEKGWAWWDKCVLCNECGLIMGSSGLIQGDYGVGFWWDNTRVELGTG